MVRMAQYDEKQANACMKTQAFIWQLVEELYRHFLGTL
jgi:hypothetical protein